MSPQTDAALALLGELSRDRAGRIELAARAVIATADVAGYTPQARLDALMTLRWALASADGPPEPGLDVERLARALSTVDQQGAIALLGTDDGVDAKGYPTRFDYTGVPGEVAAALAREYARLSVDGDSPGGAE